MWVLILIQISSLANTGCFWIIILQFRISGTLICFTWKKMLCIHWVWQCHWSLLCKELLTRVCCFFDANRDPTHMLEWCLTELIQFSQRTRSQVFMPYSWVWATGSTLYTSTCIIRMKLWWMRNIARRKRKVADIHLQQCLILLNIFFCKILLQST